MNETKDVLQGKWHEVKGRAKQQWGKLSDDDLESIHGKNEELSGLLQKRYGYDKAKADLEIHQWLTRYDEETARTPRR